MKRKIVDIFLQDRLIASYPVVIDETRHTVSDRDFVEHIKRRMRRRGSAFDVSAVKFIVRSPAE